MPDPTQLPSTDVAIIGAGPYGLSIAAHLAATSLRTRIFGIPMDSWRNHMPRGMKLKSEGFASNLSAPVPFTLEQFSREQNLPYEHVGLPVPIETFIAYGLEFQRRLVPHLEQTDITHVQQIPEGFQLQTAAGEIFIARRVVIATGLTSFAHIPTNLAHIPSPYLAHTFDPQDLTTYRTRRVLVLGAGASAVDTAALLHQAGANVQIIARSPSIAFHEPSTPRRSLLTRLKNPRSGLGVGWKSYLTSNFPRVFHALPSKLRVRAVQRHLGPAPGWFVTNLVVGKIPMHLNATITSANIVNDQLEIALAQPTGNQTLFADHLILGTGFRISMDHLAFLDETLRQHIHTLEGAPILNPHFESSIPHLYFVGLASAYSYGPLTRFAYGADYTAHRLARHLKG